MTTWVMQAVAINNETGLGLATPLRILSRKDIFVSLKIPYSVKRGEQVSLLVTAFNYVEEELQVYPEGCTCDGKVTLRLARGEVRVSSRIKKKNFWLLPETFRKTSFYCHPVIEPMSPTDGFTTKKHWAWFRVSLS